MENQNYSAVFVVDKSPETVFKAITNFRAWWSEDIEGITDKLNEEFFYQYKDIHLCKIKLVEMKLNEKLIYHILDNQFSFTKDKNEWIDTRLIFEISEKDDKTIVDFHTCRTCAGI